MSKPSAQTGLGSLATGAVTALAIAVQTGLAAVVGVIIARELGRTAETDGFFAAYAVFIVLALAATAIRVTVLPPLARARAERRLSSETVSYALSIGMIAAPVLAVGIVAAMARDVVERARRGRADERDHMCAERDERVGEVRAHEAVRSGDEARAVAVEVAELAPKRLVLSLGPRVGMVARHRWRIAPTPAGERSAAAC